VDEMKPKETRPRKVYNVVLFRRSTHSQNTIKVRRTERGGRKSREGGERFLNVSRLISPQKVGGQEGLIGCGARKRGK